MISSNPVHAERPIRTAWVPVASLLCVGILFPSSPAYALSAPHHLYNFSRRLVEVVGAPLYAIFYDGPKRIKKAYQDEVWGVEKPEKRGKMINRLKSVPRAIGEEAKAAVDGVTQSVGSGGQAVKELISIFFGD